MGINVLSLFDGMSCGQIALQKLGIEVDSYFACEIDKHAMGVTRFNFPETVFLGDVRDLDVSKLPKIDLLLGGSPCTSISVAGKQEGIGTTNLETYLKLKEEGFEFEGQSFLFWEYIRIRKELMEINPNLKWLLENVKMKKDFKKIFDEVAGGNCIEINSALVSAQNRVRNYWHNFGEVPQPEDKGILLKDVLENGVVDREKSYCIDANYWKGGNLKTYFEKSRRQLVFLFKNSFESYRKLLPIECERLQTVPDRYVEKEVVLKQKKKNGVIVSEEWVTQETPKTHRYKMLGNGWTVDVVVHLLNFANLVSLTKNRRYI
jgi:site-specific DNA-cytosine methylase